MKRTAADITLDFIDHINSHDVNLLAALMTEDHLFVDGLGNEVRGRPQMEKGWRTYFGLFPDYSIEVHHVLSEGQVAAIIGTAQGTYADNGKLLAENRWRIPSAWIAILRDGLVAEWRVYADNEPVWKIMRVNRYRESTRC